VRAQVGERKRSKEARWDVGRGEREHHLRASVLFVVSTVLQAHELETMRRLPLFERKKKVSHFDPMMLQLLFCIHGFEKGKGLGFGRGPRWNPKKPG
jgi:hypothetical protein